MAKIPVGSHVRVKNTVYPTSMRGLVGIVEPNDFDKYDYRVRFDTVSTLLFGTPIDVSPVVYFYEGELECLSLEPIR